MPSGAEYECEYVCEEGAYTFYEYFNLNDNLLSGIVVVVVVAAIATRITTTMVYMERVNACLYACMHACMHVYGSRCCPSFGCLLCP